MDNAQRNIGIVTNFRELLELFISKKEGIYMTTFPSEPDYEVFIYLFL
jgi:hypothetical protein